MIGKPKYKICDYVKFNIEGKEKSGTIYIIDKYVAFEDNSCVSYDIMYEYEGSKCLFKHIPEKYVFK